MAALSSMVDRLESTTDCLKALLEGVDLRSHQ